MLIIHVEGMSGALHICSVLVWISMQRQSVWSSLNINKVKCINKSLEYHVVHTVRPSQRSNRASSIKTFCPDEEQFMTFINSWLCLEIPLRYFKGWIKQTNGVSREDFRIRSDKITYLCLLLCLVRNSIPCPCFCLSWDFTVSQPNCFSPVKSNSTPS